ncbi:hypothetical protein [Hymenobacter jeollabukensis]|nr:hypothetical protein [Hymenobacter jeollabukensis]
MTSLAMNAQIDNLIASQYTTRQYGELEAVSMLFRQAFLTGLKSILNHNPWYRPNIKSRYNIRIGWIDKIPLAEFNSPVTGVNGATITQRVEIGDFMIILSENHLQRNPDDTIRYCENQRALIVQAKLSNQQNPTSPIGHIPPSGVNSTLKELALLSSWPSFDLYLASRSKTQILPNLNIPFDPQQSCFSGFYNKKWFCGQAANKAPCNLSLGEVIEKITNRNAGFVFNEVSPKNDWDKLIKSMVDICRIRNRPKHYINTAAPGRLLSAFTQLINDTQYEDLVLEEDNPAFPILFIDRYLIEGE